MTEDDDNNKGYLYALSKDGTRKWKAKLTKDLASAEDFYAFTPEGKQKFKRAVTKIKGGAPGTPSLSKDGVFYIEYSRCATPTITAVTSSGKVKWVKEWELSATGAISKDGIMYAPVWTDGLLALDQKGETKWRRSGKYFHQLMQHLRLA